MTRFLVTRVCMDVLCKLRQPKIESLTHFPSVERHLDGPHERDAFYDAYNTASNRGTKMSPRFEAALTAGTVLGCCKLSTEDFSTMLGRKLGQKPSNPDPYGGGDWRIGSKIWRILDTYGDEDMDKGTDIVYTLCAVSGLQVVVADFYWCFNKNRLRVRNEAQGKLEKPVGLLSKRAFFYDPVKAVVSLRHTGDRRIEIHVE